MSPTKQAESQAAERERVDALVAASPPPRLGVLDRDVFTVEDLAVVLDLEPRTIREWITRGDLRAFKFGNRGGYRIRVEVIREYLARLEGETMNALQVAREARGS